jgi:hypothetical protein
MVMDATGFDSLARRLAVGVTRRRALRWLGAGGVFAALAGPGLEEAAAAKCRPGKKRCRGRCIPKSRCCPTKARCCRNTDCPRGGICANRKCVTGRGTCAIGASTCANTGNPFCQDITGQRTCICHQRLQGGTRCGIFGNASTCDQCTTDAQCLNLGFPAGSSCVQDYGPDCLACLNDNRGICILPCGLPDPT